MSELYFITHPQVVVDPAVPVPQWPLSAVGLARMTALLRQPWVPGIMRLFASPERKALDGAGVLGRHLHLSVAQVADLAEIDRSTTGYLPHAEHELVTDEFFASPGESVRGWERAVDAQRRIVAAVAGLAAGAGDMAVVSHGAVGALLLGHLTSSEITRDHDQPGAGGGNYFAVRDGALLHGWRPIDGLPL
jgi:broad specificity phosphatase PhoE